MKKAFAPCLPAHIFKFRFLFRYRKTKPLTIPQRWNTGAWPGISFERACQKDEFMTTWFLAWVLRERKVPEFAEGILKIPQVSVPQTSVSLYPARASIGIAASYT